MMNASFCLWKFIASMLRADEVSFCKEVFDFKLKTIFGASVKDGMIIPTLHRPHWVTLQRAEVEIIAVKSRYNKPSWILTSPEFKSISSYQQQLELAMHWQESVDEIWLLLLVARWCTSTWHLCCSLLITSCLQVLRIPNLNPIPYAYAIDRFIKNTVAIS